MDPGSVSSAYGPNSFGACGSETSNILLDESLKVFITDLGIQRDQGTGFDVFWRVSAGYAAPEQVLFDVAQYHITSKS